MGASRNRRVIKQTTRQCLRKEPEMAYKKPQIVAKSAAKQSFVAGCGANTCMGCFAANPDAKKCASPKMK